MHAKSRNEIRGLSLVEVLLTVSALGIIGALAVSRTTHIQDGVRHTKLEQDVKHINSAVKIYVANGGSFEGASAPQEILDRLKSNATDADKMQFVGITGSTLDKRVAVNTGSKKTRSVAVWSPSSQQFNIVDFVDGGVTSFYLNEALASVDFQAVGREASTFSYGEESGWIWDYEDKPTTSRGGPTVVTVEDPKDTTPPPVPVMLSAPAISPTGGSFPESDFPKTISVINPNDPSTWLLVSINGDPFAPYTGPITLADAGALVAYAAGDPTYWVDSANASASFAKLPPLPPSQLTAPLIDLSSPQFNDSVSDITIAITNPNLAGSSSLYYSIVPQGGTHAEASTWDPATNALTVSATQYPDGFNVIAYAKSSDPSRYIDSWPADAFTTAEFYDIPVIGNVLFVLDASSSMGNSFGNTTRFKATVDELVQAIDKLPNNLKFNVAMFDSNIHWTDGSFTLHPANANNKQSLINQIQQLDHGSGTNYAAAFELPSLFSPVPEQVIFLSDGAPNNTPYQNLVSSLAAQGIRIDAIGLDLDNSATSILEQIVGLTGGSLVTVEE